MNLFKKDSEPTELDITKDKIWKKVTLNHTGEGSYSFQWNTEISSDSLSIDLSSNPVRFDSFFQSTAIGRVIRAKIYKNDLEDFSLREMHLMYTEKPTII